MAIGGEKMDNQKTLWEQVTDSEAIFYDQDLEEMFWKEREEPCDLADQAHEQWRDEGNPEERHLSPQTYGS
jgi:hypothetical protein